MRSTVVGPLRWLGAIAVLGFIVALIVPMAMDAARTSIHFSTAGEDGSIAAPTTEDATTAPTEASTAPADGDGNGGTEPDATEEPDDGGDGGDENGDDDENSGDGGNENGDDDGDGGDGDDGGDLPQTYTVQSGDTGFAIAERLYGDRDMWPVIAEVNGITDSSALRVGQELELPPPE